MSARLTKCWTETAEQAFGSVGKKGERGERIAKSILEEMGYSVTHHPSDKKLQLAGIDLFIDGKYGVDVKNNLKTGEDVCVEQKKLFKSKATFWMHINDEDREDFVFYKVEDMKKWLTKNANSVDKLVWVPRKDVDNLSTLT